MSKKFLLSLIMDDLKENARTVMHITSWQKLLITFVYLDTAKRDISF